MKKITKYITKLGTLFFLLCIGNYVNAQTEISGTVKDGSGIVIPGANIILQT